MIIVELGRSERRVPVEGIVRDPTAQPPALGGNAAFYTTLETLAWLTGEDEDFSRLHVRLESFTEEGAEEAAEQIQDRLEGMGVGVGGYGITDPKVHPAQETIDSLLLILTVMGMLSLGLSGFLIVNTMNALVAQQVWQIGVMKVVGATVGRVVRLYLSTALVYGLMSLLLAVPMGAVAAYGVAIWFLDIVHVAVGPFRVMPQALGIQIGVGLVVPFVAALIPVVGGARITAHEAISSYGLGAGFGLNWLDRLIGRIRRLPRMLALGMRNTFRRKARIALTLLTLVLGGLMFILVMSVGTSLDNTLEVLLDDLGFDVLVVLDNLYRVEPLTDAAESVSGVVRAEVWDQRRADLTVGEDEEREVYVWAVPPDSEMFRPRITSGRALLPGDGRAILLNSKIASDEGFQVEDEIKLTIGDQESVWTVVGLVLNVNNLQRDNFVPFDALARETSSHNRGAVVMIGSDQDDAATQERLIDDLREAYAGRRMEVQFVQSAHQARQANKAVFNVIVYLMLVMAVLAALVGSVGLMSTMSINVVERAREIGVMRAIGATSAIILGVFVFEGVLVGVLSWVIAAPLSYPSAWVFSDAIGRALLEAPLDFSFSIAGLAIWLVIVIALSAVASLWPALRATQVSVREALAYE
jgi:putative ABC transport system permease protein